MKNTINFIVASSLLISGCLNTNAHHSKHKVHVLKSDVMFYYVIVSDNGTSSYNYSSTTRVTNFNNVAWVSGRTNVPPNAKEIEETEIDENVLPENIQNEMEENETNDGTETTDDSDSGSDSGSDAGSDSGGDSGGGDGGGGE